MPRIVIGITCNQQVDAFFAQTFSGALVGHGELFWAEQCWSIGAITDDGRNTIVKKALENDFDYVFFMDSDMIFPRGALARIIASQHEIAGKYPEFINIPTVIGGVYNTRSDHRINVYDWKKDKNSFQVKEVELDSGVVKADFVATGCQLIDCNVFKQIDFPYFEYWYKEWNENNEIGRWSEDAVFAYKCMEKGIPHFVDTSIVCGHLHEVNIVQADSKNYEVRKLSGELYGTQRQPESSSERIKKN